MEKKESYSMDEVLKLVASSWKKGYEAGYVDCLMAYYEVLEGTEVFDKDCEKFGVRSADHE